MQNFLFTLLIISSSLYSLSLEEIITNALNKNPSLKVIKHRIESSKSLTNISNQFSDPKLIYTQNTLDDKQAMSTKTLLLRQKLPYFGKLDSLKNIALVDEEIQKTNLDIAKVELVKNIKIQAYEIWKLEQLYKIINEYEELTKQNIELFESYTSTANNQHIEIMSAELTLSDLRIQKSQLNAQIISAYAKLSYLSSQKVKKLKLDLYITDLPSITELQIGLKNNKKLCIKNKEVLKTKALIKNAKLNYYPDINLIAGYTQRNNFDDFATFGFELSLPIYGTQKYKEEEKYASALSVRSMKKDIKVEIDSNFEVAYAQMKSAYEIYTIINKNALPKVDHMLELISSSIASGEDLFRHIDILIQMLKLEQKSILAIVLYHNSYANISALKGEIK
jgi:outer membrane protein TolC